jgi:cyanate lyase
VSQAILKLNSSKFMTVEFSAVTQTLLAAKKAKGLSFGDLEQLLGHDEVWIASLFYGQNSTSLTEAEKIAEVLGLGEDVVQALIAHPSKGLGPVVPTDPLIYRFYEIIQVYGYPIKEVIQEKFGAGIMSAIDFSLNIDKVADPQGDRVKITMNGKFLPYKKW